ncbi:YybS family protein [Bacillus sp. IITD106]|nr:YybS family protein [Bacillus sp. IITD106]
MFSKSISNDATKIHDAFNLYSTTNKMVVVSLLSCLAAVLQASGGFIPVIGLFISPFSTAPIIVCTIFSLRYGFLSYLSTILLLFILQPSELIVFPFTTGLLGLGIGFSFLFFKKRFTILLGGTASLFLGIIVVLYVFKFPLLGPVASTSFNVFTTGSILLFSLFYSWIWIEISVASFKHIKKFT